MPKMGKYTVDQIKSRSARTARIEIYIKPGEADDDEGRGPQGPRGLKFHRHSFRNLGLSVAVRKDRED